jgi:hypothetical protein
MSVSTDAILFYGYCWNEEGNLLESEDEDGDSEWPKVVLRKRGLKSPWDEYTKRCVSATEWIKVNRVQLDAWSDACRALEEEFGCDIYRHCSGDCPIPYVAITKARQRVSCGYPEPVLARTLTADSAWAAMLDRFLAELGIAKPEGQEQPQWWLCSYWG